MTMNNIGTLLQQKRITEGLTIEQVAEELNIRPFYLVAIEEDLSTPDIPPPVYMLGYLKMYANFLGLNGQIITDKLKHSTIDNSELYVPNPYLDDNRPSAAILTIAVALICTVVLLWYFIARNDTLFNTDQYVAYKEVVQNDLGNKLYKNFELKSLISTSNVPVSQNKIILFASQNSGIKILDPDADNVWHHIMVVAGNFYVVHPNMHIEAPAERVIKLLANNG